MTLVSLIDRAKSYSLTYNIVAPTTSNITIPPFNCTPTNPHILFLLNFTTSQRSALLNTSLALLYTPNNEHFGPGPLNALGGYALPRVKYGGKRFSKSSILLMRNARPWQRGVGRGQEECL